MTEPFDPSILQTNDDIDQDIDLIEHPTLPTMLRPDSKPDYPPIPSDIWATGTSSQRDIIIYHRSDLHTTWRVSASIGFLKLQERIQKNGPFCCNFAFRKEKIISDSVEWDEVKKILTQDINNQNVIVLEEYTWVEE